VVGAGATGAAVGAGAAGAAVGAGCEGAGSSGSSLLHATASSAAAIRAVAANNPILLTERIYSLLESFYLSHFSNIANKSVDMIYNFSKMSSQS
jgi:hypothetical protein